MQDNYYNEIKHTLIKNNVTRAVKQYSINRSDLNTYYEVGRLLSEAVSTMAKELLMSIQKG